MNTDDMLELARQDRPVSREELGIDYTDSIDGLQTLNEGFDFKSKILDIFHKNKKSIERG